MDKDYAKALWKILEDGAKPKEAVKTLYETLKARGRLGLLSKIARAFSLLASRDESQNRIVLAVARASDAKRALKEAEAMLKNAGVKPSKMKTDVEESLIGGWRLEGKEALHDNSYKKHLLSMYNRITIT